jgi:hypothetical protein
MNRGEVVASLRAIGNSLGAIAAGTEWHLFGSVDQNSPNPTDIDLMILCQSAAQADLLRRAIDDDALALRIDLALLTFEEAAEVNAVGTQRSNVIFP